VIDIGRMVIEHRVRLPDPPAAVIRHLGGGGRGEGGAGGVRDVGGRRVRVGAAGVFGGRARDHVVRCEADAQLAVLCGAG
jgi:hypothetical protein